jgi:predicted nucleic acid-binding protein
MEELRTQSLSNLLVTTDHVVAETITVARFKGPHALAVSAGELLFDEKIARIEWASEQDQRDAFEYFKKHDDKHYSMVDCLSFVVMERLGIQEALAVDRDFTHRFVARPGPRQ